MEKIIENIDDIIIIENWGEYDTEKKKEENIEQMVVPEESD